MYFFFLFFFLSPVNGGQRNYVLVFSRRLYPAIYGSFEIRLNLRVGESWFILITNKKRGKKKNGLEINERIIIFSLSVESVNVFIYLLNLVLIFTFESNLNVRLNCEFTQGN